MFDSQEASKSEISVIQLQLKQLLVLPTLGLFSQGFFQLNNIHLLEKQLTKLSYQAKVYQA